MQCKTTGWIGMIAGIVMMSQPAQAQDDYSGGWSVPSLDTATLITNNVVTSEAIMRAGGVEPKKSASAKKLAPAKKSRPRLYIAFRDASKAGVNSAQYTASSNSVEADFGTTELRKMTMGASGLVLK